MALTLDIGANTREAQRNVKDLGVALDDVADALDGVARDAVSDGQKVERALDGAADAATDLGKDARDAGRDSERALDSIGDAATDTARDVRRAGDDTERALDDVGDAGKDAGRDIETAGDKVERTFRDMVQDARKAERAVDDVGDGGRQSLSKVKDAAGEVQSEIGQNMSETFSSFRGEIEDLGQIGQDTLGGLAGTVAQMGPAGIVGAAGLGAAAAAVGLITDAFTKAKEATDEAKESAYQYGITVAETGQYADVAGRINELTGSIEGLKQVQDIATIAGWDQVDVVKALATGDGLPALTRAFDKNADQTAIATGRVLELDGKLRGAAQGFDLAKDAAGVNSRALYDLATKAGKATGEVDDLGNAIYQMPDGKEIVVNAVTKEAFQDIDALERRKISPKNATVRVNVDDRAWRNWTPVSKTGRVSAQVTRGRAMSWE